MFEKTRSKKRRPFTEEEDRALKAGYDKYGTLWSQIVKDPIFAEQKRRSTDLRDRFRNAFPELYQAAGYKPRPAPKKKRHDGYPPMGPTRAATDDQLLTTRMVSPQLRRRAGTNPNRSRSAPHSAAASEDEETSDGEEDSPPVPSTSKTTQESTPVSALAEDLSATSEFTMTELGMADIEALCEIQAKPVASSQNSFNSMSHSTAHSSGRESPIFYEGWNSTAAAASPTSSQLSQLSNTDFMTNDSQMRRMIGKSGWGTSDWLSANPRMDPSASISSNSSFVDASPVPSSPFSFSNISHGIMDRYDLFPASFAHDISSEVGYGDTHSAFSDPEMFPTQTFRGFTHHSDYAGDLIFGTRGHQPQNQGGYTAMNGLPFSGLGLSGMTQQPPPPTSINPIQLHTPMLPGIDEIELSSISLDDHVENDDNMIDATNLNINKAPPQLDMDPDMSQLKAMIQNLNDIGTDISSHDMTLNPPDTPVRASRPLREVGEQHQYSGNHNRSSSVPPSEHRVPLPPTRAHQLYTHVMPMPPMRSFSQASHDALNGHFGMLPQGLPPNSGNPNMLKAAGDPHTLSFLDMHYFNSGVGMSALHHEIENLGTSDSRHGQALDLAQTHSVSSVPHFAAQPATVSPTQLLNSLNAAASRPYVNHTRVQSAISPKDLLLNSSNENKRKRVSWDGTSG